LMSIFKPLKVGIAISMFMWLNCVFATDWPTIAFPSDVKPFSVADSMEVNGITMQVYGYFSRQSVKDLQSWYEKNTTQKWSISSSGKKQILGTPIDDFYITIQLEATGLEGSKAIVSSTKVSQATQGIKDYQQSKAQWLNKLPSGTLIQQLNKSIDNGKQALYLQAYNNKSAQQNEAHIVSTLRQMGYEADKFQTNQKRAASLNTPSADQRGVLLFLNSKNGEAVLAIKELDDVKTAIAINILEKIR
jgi:hypothetical protein